MRINVNWLNHIGNFAYIVSFFKFYCLYISIILKSFLNQFASISIVSGRCFHFIFIFIFRRCLLLSFVQFPSLLLQQKANCVFLSLFLFIVRYYCTQSKTLSPVQLGIYVKWNLQWNIKWEMVASIVYSNRLQIELLRSYFHSFVTSVFAIVPLYTVCVCVCLSLSLLAWITSKANRRFSFQTTRWHKETKYNRFPLSTNFLLLALLLLLFVQEFVSFWASYSLDFYFYFSLWTGFVLGKKDALNENINPANWMKSSKKKNEQIHRVLCLIWIHGALRVYLFFPPPHN